MKHSDPSSGSNDPPGGPKVMKIAELASYLRVHPTTIYRLLKGNAIPGFRIGSDWRFNVEEIDAWLSKLGGQADTVVKR
jgi:excisionase family DNA binding protein